LLSGETQKLNMYQAINHGLNIALENDPRSGEDFFILVFFLTEICNYVYVNMHRSIKKKN